MEAEFQQKFGDAHSQWKLPREDEVILLGDTVMMPDFALNHKKNGRRALIEIVGFWHPEYLRRKIGQVRAAHRQDMTWPVYEGVNLATERLRHVLKVYYPALLVMFRRIDLPLSWDPWNTSPIQSGSVGD